MPKSSLLPTHNKQDFNDHAEYKKLRKCVDQAMQQYWEDVVMGEWSHKGIQDGWALLGYAQDWRKPPSEEEEYKIRRARLVKHLQQCGKLISCRVLTSYLLLLLLNIKKRKMYVVKFTCSSLELSSSLTSSVFMLVDKCLKWRVIPYHKNYLYKDFPDDWQCAHSLDPSTNSCSKPEALPKIESSPLKPKAQLKAAAVETSKKDSTASSSAAASKRMSAATQEQKQLEEKV